MKQHIPDLDIDNFAFGQIGKLFDDGKIFINTEYQRGDIWKQNQQIELIQSIVNCYSIGVLVLYVNDKKQYEILDGQQRILTIYKYVNNKLNLENSDVRIYKDLTERERIFLDSYSVYYLKLKSHNPETKEEDIVQTFLRLQEGTPLNKAEKINAYRGQFKETFVKIRSEHPIFQMLGNDKRFRFRQLAAELLLLEFEGDYKNLVFPGLDLPTFKTVIKKYESKISDRKISFLIGNLDFIYQSLNLLLTAITPRELIPIYLLVSFLRKNKADNSRLRDELSVFIEDLLMDLNSFTIYNTKPPNGMKQSVFRKYLTYKSEARKATTSDSIQYRLKFFIEEFDKKKKIIYKDPKRLHDKEQKRLLYLRQKGICPECGQKIDFRVDGSAHHAIAHKDGGSTDDLSTAVLLHERCHKRLEKRLEKQRNV